MDSIVGGLISWSEYLIIYCGRDFSNYFLDYPRYKGNIDKAKKMILKERKHDLNEINNINERIYKDNLKSLNQK